MLIRRLIRSNFAALKIDFAFAFEPVANFDPNSQATVSLKGPLLPPSSSRDEIKPGHVRAQFFSAHSGLGKFESTRLENRKNRDQE
jgi:hypothetical protein